MGLVLSSPILATVIALVIAHDVPCTCMFVLGGVFRVITFCENIEILVYYQYVGILVLGRQVAYHFLCDCVFNFKQVGPDTMRCNFHSGVEFSVSGYYAKFQDSVLGFKNRDVSILCHSPEYYVDFFNYTVRTMDAFWCINFSCVALGNALKKQRLGHEAKKRLYAEEAPTELWLKRATIDDEYLITIFDKLVLIILKYALFYVLVKHDEWCMLGFYASFFTLWHVYLNNTIKGFSFKDCVKFLPVDPHMQRPPRGGIWVGITYDISKSNCKLPNYHYSDSIIFDNTMQVIPGEWLHISIIIHHIDEYDNIHQFVWTSTHLIAVITYFPAGLRIYVCTNRNLYMDFHTQLPPCGEIRKSVLRTFVNFILYNVRTTGPKADVRQEM
ncbi:hypothetical protein V1478_003008 [Vespula squamosa]|uniref:Uncharacterized protein n=1 Tax=Vespula squamosa TaxID=30214 RepID=A0ABD2BRF6_VESSQ